MQQNVLLPVPLNYWQTRFDAENTIALLSSVGFCTFDDALPIDAMALLQTESQALNYAAAAIHKGGIANALRSDSTCWITPEHIAHGIYLPHLAAISTLCNQHLYTGIRWAEAHYAYYQPQQFYAQHSDNSNGSNIRAISAVLYLNSHWQTHWGGELILHDTLNAPHTLLPVANTLVIFQSDLLHEVRPTQHPRHSITAWLRRDNPISHLL